MGTEEKDLHDRLFVRDFDTLAAVCQRNYKSDGQLSHKVISNGIVLPIKKSTDGKKLGGVCDENFNFISGSAMKRSRTLNFISYGVVNGGYSVPKDELEYIDETVIYGGSVTYGFYESFFIFLAAFNWWHVQHPDCNYKIVLVHFDAPFSVNYQKTRIINFMSLLNIKADRLIFCDKPSQFKQVIVPDTAVCEAGDYYDEYASIFSYIRQSIQPALYKKVYLTRSEYIKRGSVHDCVNEEYFEDFYRKKGYEIIAPEKYSLRDQIAIFAGADEIVSVLGSAILSAASFVRPGTKMVCLNRIDNTDEISFHVLSLISQMNNLDYYFVDVSYNFLNQCLDSGASLLGPTEYWKNYVKNTYGEEIEADREKVLKEFSYQYIRNWTELSEYPSLYTIIKYIDNFDILNNMSRVILGKELDKEKFDVGLTKLELNRKVNELNRKVNELNVKLENANKELSNDTHLAKLSAIERQIGSVADVIQKAQLSCAERESLMKQNAALSAQIEAQNIYINYTNINIEKMQENNQMLSEFCKSVTDQKDELVKENESITAEAVLKDHNIEVLKSDLANSKNVILNLQNDVDTLKEHIANIENSNSWKITKPFRAIKRLFSKH